MEAGARLGPYRVLSEIGSGGMGSVFLAEGPEGRVAIKVIHPALLEEEGFFQRFLLEAELGRRVAHENVVRTLGADAVVVDGSLRHFLVMEHVEGQTLRDLLHEMGRVPEDLCRHIGREVAKGLRAIHEAGAVHRDLKPENVLITADHVVKVMDLGVAHLAGEALRRSIAGGFVGTLLYAAPEQFEGAEPDGRADFYALGLVLYELATGEHPSRADDPAEVMHRRLAGPPPPAGNLNPQLSPYFEEVLEALLERDRERRPDFFPEEDSDWWRERAQRIRTETRRPLRRMRIPRETALFGREAELALLRGLLAKACEGDGQVLLIEGEAGIGKTRLVDEFVGAAGADVMFLHGAYPPGGAATASGAFAAAYREHFGEAGSGAWLGEAPLLVPAFDALLRGDAPPKGAEPLSRDSIQACFAHATRSLARERPTIIMIDDLHFAPEEGRALFASLAHAVSGHRVLLVGTLRTGGPPAEWLAAIERQPHVKRIALSRLGAADLVRLLEDSLRSATLARELAGPIALKSDGNPFFVFEIVHGLREGRLLDRTPDGTWVKTQAIEQIAIPASVLDLIRARIADLAEEERELLDIASCLGFEFDPLLVGEVLGIARIPLLKRFAQIERKHRLVRSSGLSYIFDHHQVQEALYESLPELLRREYHGALGEALERRGASRGLAVVACAEHFLKAARGDATLRHLDPALAHLETACLYERAAALAQRSLDEPGLLAGHPRAEVLLRLSVALGNLGRHDAQQLAIEEALEAAAGDPGLSARAERAKGNCLWQTSRYADAERSFLTALDLARKAGDRKTEAACMSNLGLALTDLGRYEEALEWQERTVAASRELEYARGEAIAHGNLSTLLVNLGRYDEARPHMEKHLALAREVGYRQGEAIAHGNIGFFHLQRGRFEEALPHLRAHLELAGSIGYRSGEARALGNLGFVSCELGRYGDAREYFNRHLELSREVGFRDGEALALENLGSIAAVLGDTDAARERLEESLRITRETGSRRIEGYVLHRLGDLARDRGEPEEAMRLYDEALGLRRGIGYRKGVAETLLAISRLESGGVRGPGLDEAIALAQELDMPAVRVLARILRASLPGGDPADAAAAYAADGTRLGHPERMEARFALWRATGDGSHLAEAKRLLDEEIAHAPPEYRVAMVERVPLHRDIRRA